MEQVEQVEHSRSQGVFSVPPAVPPRVARWNTPGRAKFSRVRSFNLTEAGIVAFMPKYDSSSEPQNRLAVPAAILASDGTWFDVAGSFHYENLDASFITTLPAAHRNDASSRARVVISRDHIVAMVYSTSS